jgi:hypothetical protein
MDISICCGLLVTCDHVPPCASVLSDGRCSGRTDIYIGGGIEKWKGIYPQTQRKGRVRTYVYNKWCARPEVRTYVHRSG